MARYDTDKNFERYDGLDKPRNPKGIFVVPTGSASVLQVSSSIKGGTIGSTKDTLDLLSNLEDGGEYEETWHESVHYLDKRVTEISNGLNKLADAQSNLSGSSASSIATNRAKTPLTIGTGGSNALAGNTTTISTAQANAITANSAKVSMVIGTKPSLALAGNTTTISDAQATILQQTIVSSSAQISSDISGSFTAASASFHTRVVANEAASGSFSSRVTANDAKTGISTSQASAITANTAKVSMVIGSRSTQAKAGNTTTISTQQASLLTGLQKGISNATGHSIKFALAENGSLVISIDRSTYTISAG